MRIETGSVRMLLPLPLRKGVGGQVPMAEPLRQEDVDRDDSERIYTAGQWQLAWRKFRLNRLALASGAVLGALYLLTLFSALALNSHLSGFEM